MHNKQSHQAKKKKKKKLADQTQPTKLTNCKQTNKGIHGYVSVCL